MGTLASCHKVSKLQQTVGNAAEKELIDNAGDVQLHQPVSVEVCRNTTTVPGLKLDEVTPRSASDDLRSTDRPPEVPIMRRRGNTENRRRTGMSRVVKTPPRTDSQSQALAAAESPARDCQPTAVPTEGGSGVWPFMPTPERRHNDDTSLDRQDSSIPASERPTSTEHTTRSSAASSVPDSCRTTTTSMTRTTTSELPPLRTTVSVKYRNLPDADLQASPKLCNLPDADPMERTKPSLPTDGIETEGGQISIEKLLQKVEDAIQKEAVAEDAAKKKKQMQDESDEKLDENRDMGRQGAGDIQDDRWFARQPLSRGRSPQMLSATSPPYAYASPPKKDSDASTTPPAATPPAPASYRGVPRSPQMNKDYPATPKSATPPSIARTPIGSPHGVFHSPQKSREATPVLRSPASVSSTTRSPRTETSLPPISSPRSPPTPTLWRTTPPRIAGQASQAHPNFPPPVSPLAYQGSPRHSSEGSLLPATLPTSPLSHGDVTRSPTKTSETFSPPTTVTLHRLRAQTVTFSDECKREVKATPPTPPPTPPPGTVPPLTSKSLKLEVPKELRFSLEQLLQKYMPNDAEVLEVGAVTGVPARKKDRAGGEGGGDRPQGTSSAAGEATENTEQQLSSTSLHLDASEFSFFASESVSNVVVEASKKGREGSGSTAHCPPPQSPGQHSDAEERASNPCDGAASNPCDQAERSRTLGTTDILGRENLKVESTSRLYYIIKEPLSKVPEEDEEEEEEGEEKEEDDEGSEKYGNPGNKTMTPETFENAEEEAQAALKQNNNTGGVDTVCGTDVDGDSGTENGDSNCDEEERGQTRED